MDSTYSKQVASYIASAGADQKPLLEELQHLIHETIPGTFEAIKWGFLVFAKGKDYAYLRFSKKHVTLGFYHIYKIDDPDRKLEGSGNTLRHIKIRKPDDIDKLLISKWLLAIAS